MRLALVIVGAALVACSSAGEIDLEGRVCASGEVECLEGYVCHPERERCVCSIDIGCDGASSCPQLTQTGDPCPCPGAFISCDGAVDDCEHGCRDCRADLTWSVCSDKTCDSAAPELCDGRDNDCDELADEGIYGCDCFGGTPTTEVCDQRDNDCNTAIDDGFPCRFDSVRPCDGGIGNESCDPATCTWSGECVTRDDVPPGLVSLFVAQAQNARVQLSWLHPNDSDLDMCVVRRRVVDHPNHHLVGDLVHVTIGPAPGSAASAVDEGLTNGVRYAYAAFCRDTAGTWNDSLQIPINADDAIPTAGSAVNPTDLEASDGDDRQSTISFSIPPAALECRLRRKRNDVAVDYPGGHEEVGSDLLFTFTSMAQLPYVDPGLVNGGTYYYAVFCFNGEEWNDSVVPGANGDLAQPRNPVPDNPTDFDAQDDEDSLSTLTFTMPAVEECRVLRRNDGAYPAAEDDGDLVGTFTVPGAVRLVDTGLSNGSTYYYAVFCRDGTTWNRERLDANADTAGPVDVAIVREDLVARGTRDSTTAVSDAVTFVDNRLYLAVVTTRPYQPALGVTGFNFTWTQAVSQCGANDETGTEIWWAFGTPSGSNQVRANLPAQADGAMLAVLRYGGVNSAQPLGSHVSTNSGGGACTDAAASGSWALAIPTTATDSVIFGSVAILGAEHVPGSGVTELTEARAYTGSNEVAAALVESPVGGSASVSLTGSLTVSEKWAAFAIELKP